MDQFHDRRRHGDPFPLNVEEVKVLAETSQVFEPQRARWIGDSLNRLALHDGNSLNSPMISSARQPTVVQDYVNGRIVESLKLHGERPAGLSAESALSELQAAEVSYDGTPNNLANYDPAKLKILRSRVQPKRISSFLPAEPAKLVEHYESQILAPEQPDSEPFSPYWDPQLRYNKAKRLDFILQLHKSGLVSLRRSPKSFIGAFFVKKKTPDAIRMVLDCRGTNRLHQPPPTTRLGSARGYADLDLSKEPEGSGWGIEADVNDAFYNFSIPELTHYFAFNHPLTASEWSQLGLDASRVYDPSLRHHVITNPDELLFPCVEAVPMGWSWALFLCNEAVLNLCLRNAPWIDGVFREKKVAPQLRDYRTSLGVYVDNITIVGRSKDDVAHRAECVKQAFATADIPLTWTQDEPVKSLESVGCILDLDKKLVYNKPKRVWKFHLATLAILRRDKVKGKLLQIWAGHFTSLCALTPWGLACLQDVYRFVENAKTKRVKLWPSVRRELKVASAVVWMTWRELGAPFSELVEVGDSSSRGYAMMACSPGLDRIRKATSFHEKWRFIAMPECLKKAIAHRDAQKFEDALQGVLGLPSTSDPTECAPVAAAGLTTSYAKQVIEAVTEGSWLSTSAIRSQIRASPSKRVDVDVPALVEPVDDFFANQENFRLLWSRRWRDTTEHINIKECRVALSSLKQASRVRELAGHRKLTLSDNLATVSALSKGRSSTFKMNKLCRVASAIQFGCGIVWNLRHVETKRNVADEPSRNFDKRPLGRRAEPVSVEPWCEKRCGHTSEPSQSSIRKSPGDAVTNSVPVTHGKFFLELFAGTGKLTKAVAAQKMPVLEPVEIAADPAFDLRRRQTQNLVLKWIKSGSIGFVHLGTPCTIWSRARHGVSNTRRNLAREAEGLELALFSCEVILACNKAGVHWSLENPRSSRLFAYEPLVRASHSGPVYEVNFDMCSYGEPYKKDTRILTSCKELQGLERHCNHKRHKVWLKGQTVVEEGGHKKYCNRTKLAGAYPEQMCQKFAKLLYTTHACVSHGESDQFVQDHWSTAIRCYLPKKQQKRTKRSKDPKSQWQAEENTEGDLSLLQKAGGIQKHFDFIALGREPKQAWAFLKKAEAKRCRKVDQV